MSSRIEIFPSPAELSAACAEKFVSQAAASIQSRGRFSVALAGGSTPEKMYALLASPSVGKQVDWTKVHLFWGDERCVPVRDPRSNYLSARQTFIDIVPIPAANVHPILCIESAFKAAADYESLLHHHFFSEEPRFDLVLLGLGEDGHTASIFPDDMALENSTSWIAVTRKPGENIDRITLTPAILNLARVTLFQVSGVSKASALRHVLEPKQNETRLPAQLIRPNGQLFWFVDSDAASELQS